jgi:hypothetical protein
MMLRGIFMAPGATKDQVDYYIGLFQKVREISEWKNLMQLGAFNQSFLTGSEYSNWVARGKATRAADEDRGLSREISMIINFAGRKRFAKVAPELRRLPP